MMGTAIFTAHQEYLGKGNKIMTSEQIVREVYPNVAVAYRRGFVGYLYAIIEKSGSRSIIGEGHPLCVAWDNASKNIKEGKCPFVMSEEEDDR